jgi:hypothetical protein
VRGEGRGERGRQGDKGTRGHGDMAKGRRGEKKKWGNGERGIANKGRRLYKGINTLDIQYPPSNI